MALALDPELEVAHIFWPRTFFLTQSLSHPYFNQPTPTMASEPFRFLDLPAELRCAVYEYIDIETRLYAVDDLFPAFSDETETTPKAAIIIKDIPTAILATCRCVYAEAQPILASKLNQIRNEKHVHFIVDSWSFHTLFESAGSLRFAFLNDKKEAYENLCSKDPPWMKTLDFARNCGNYMRMIEPTKMTITIKMLEDVSNSQCSLDELDDLFWANNFGVAKFNLQLYNIDEEHLYLIDDYWQWGGSGGDFNDSPFPLTYREIEETEWDELWAIEELVGL
jgi:hypothetical protein